MATFIDKIAVTLQRLAPAGTLGSLTRRLSKIETPWIKDALIRGFCRLFEVALDEAERPVPDGYRNFNAFFTRRLKAGARPLDSSPSAVCSPCDGRVQNAGKIRQGRLMQVKGIDYSLAQLLDDDKAAERFEGGRFLTVYLAPHDYHCIHAPVDGQVTAMRYIPGGRLSVNERTARTVPGLFATNERLACYCETPDTHFAIVFVAAMNVSCIAVAWHDGVIPHQPRRARTWDYGERQGMVIDKGEFFGQFELGSTIVLLMPPQTVQWTEALRPGALLRMGERIGTLTSTDSGPTDS